MKRVIYNIKGKWFKLTNGLSEHLTRKYFNTDLITTSDLKRYKNILEMTNAHLVAYETDRDIKISCGQKFVKIISKILPQNKQRSIELALRQRWVKY
jgi:hypothetical protein